jgi:hypothetical protein
MRFSKWKGRNSGPTSLGSGGFVMVMSAGAANATVETRRQSASLGMGTGDIPACPGPLATPPNSLKSGILPLRALFGGEIEVSEFGRFAVRLLTLGLVVYAIKNRLRRAVLHQLLSFVE